MSGLIAGTISATGFYRSGNPSNFWTVESPPCRKVGGLVSFDLGHKRPPHAELISSHSDLARWLRPAGFCGRRSPGNGCLGRGLAAFEPLNVRSGPSCALGTSTWPDAGPTSNPLVHNRPTLP